MGDRRLEIPDLLLQAAQNAEKLAVGRIRRDIGQ